MLYRYWEAVLCLVPTVAVLIAAMLGASAGGMWSASYLEGVYGHAPVGISEAPTLLPTGRKPEGCPEHLVGGPCTITEVAVMGGVDVVRYFQQRDPEAFAEQGGYNESYAGEFGDPAYSSRYAGYTFLFSSHNNKLLFDFEPQKYAPQYGGFCAWGMSAEVSDLHWPWNAKCLGPSGAWAFWVIRGGRLYFFKDQVPKSNFLSDLSRYVREGDANWAEWFGEKGNVGKGGSVNGAGGGPFDTNCTLAHT